MKKPTSENLTKRLAQYGALSAAVIGVTEMNSQNIVHVDLSPNYFNGGIDSVDGTPFYPLNFDSNSLIDFSFRGLGSVSHPIAEITASPGFNSFLADSSGFPLYLNYSDPINSMPSSSAWVNAYPYGLLNASSCFNGYGNSNWCDNKTNKYLGLRFKIGTETHYGWVKLDINASGSRFTIKEYAYVEQADIGLTAGLTTLGVENASISKIKIVSSNKTIKLYNLPEQTQYQVFSITGQLALKGTTSGKTDVINATSESKGIYFIELKDTESNTVMRKKIVL